MKGTEVLTRCAQGEPERRVDGKLVRTFTRTKVLRLRLACKRYEKHLRWELYFYAHLSCPKDVGNCQWVRVNFGA